MTCQNLVVQQEGAVRTMTLNRPQALNALDPLTLDELLRCCEDVRATSDVRCVIITGAGTKAFVAGADIAAMEHMSALEGRAFACHGQRVLHAVEELPVPVIAAVNGFALGGGLELALACDLIIASQTARFGQPEINLGIIPGFGGTQRLARRVGVGAARLLIYSGEMVDAHEALRLGLVNRVVAAEALMPEVQKLASALAAKAPVALQQAKAAVNIGGDIDLRDGCRYEAEAFAVAFGSEDRVEGMRAFREKRRPTFRGR
jgi:enoyl-CoA hydratase